MNREDASRSVCERLAPHIETIDGWMYHYPAVEVIYSTHPVYRVALSKTDEVEVGDMQWVKLTWGTS